MQPALGVPSHDVSAPQHLPGEEPLLGRATRGCGGRATPTGSGSASGSRASCACVCMRVHAAVGFVARAASQDGTPGHYKILLAVDGIGMFQNGFVVVAAMEKSASTSRQCRPPRSMDGIMDYEMRPAAARRVLPQQARAD